MKFFILRTPKYASDPDYSRKNPINWVYQYSVPGVVCPVCGPWGGHRRLFTPVIDPKMQKLLKKEPYPIPLGDWKKHFDNPSGIDLGDSGFCLRPGDVLGKPTGKITNNQVSDFVFPWEGGILITEKTKKIISESRLTGCEFLHMELIDKRSKKAAEQPLPVIHVLIVTGRITPSPIIDQCPVCTRDKPNYSVALVEEKWDGNDFIIDENYPDLVFVTERVCEVFETQNLKNYQCELV